MLKCFHSVAANLAALGLQKPHENRRDVRLLGAHSEEEGSDTWAQSVLCARLHHPKQRISEQELALIRRGSICQLWLFPVQSCLGGERGEWPPSSPPPEKAPFVGLQRENK